MKKQVLVVHFLFGFLMISLLGEYGCSGDEDVVGSLSPNDRVKEIRNLVNSAGDYTTPRDIYIERPIGRGETLLGNQRWMCEKTEIKARQALDSFLFFDPNPKVIWPGAALQGKSIQRATPDPIIASRSSGKIIIGNPAGGRLSSVAVDEVTHSNVRNATDQIVRTRSDELVAGTSFSFSQVRSEEELALKLGANDSFFGLFRRGIKFADIEQPDRVSFLVTLKQVFYTLSFERPLEAADFFAEHVMAEYLSMFVSEGNYPVYVSSVTYGRIFYLIISAVGDVSEVEASIMCSFNFACDWNYMHISALEGLSIQASALGADSDTFVTAILGGPGGLNDFVDKFLNGDDLGQGMPLSYTIRTIKSGTLVKNELNTKFSIRDDCVPLP